PPQVSGCARWSRTNPAAASSQRRSACAGGGGTEGPASGGAALGPGVDGRVGGGGDGINGLIGGLAGPGLIPTTAPRRRDGYAAGTFPGQVGNLPPQWRCTLLPPTLEV